MRILLLTDTKITKRDRETVTREFSELVENHTGITPEYFIEEKDYSNVPLEKDSDGDLRPTTKYFKALTDEVHAKYDTYGVDSIVMWVHRDNWTFTGFWGTNISNVYHQYHLHLCRFDHINLANSIGTLYHEWMHCLDSLIKTHTGIEIDYYFNDVKCFRDWDSSVVHANRFGGCKVPYSYIRHKENTDALERISTPLVLAYKKRQELYEEKVGLYNKVIQVLQTKVTLLRSLLNRKNGVKK